MTHPTRMYQAAASLPPSISLDSSFEKHNSCYRVQWVSARLNLAARAAFVEPGSEDHILERHNSWAAGDRRADRRSCESGVSVVGIAARAGVMAKAESAGKWRRNGLKRLNPRPE